MIQTVFNLSTDALLMRVIIGHPGTKTHSRKLQHEAADKHDAELDSLDTRVVRLAKDAIAKVVNIEGKARSAFYFSTVRWDDNAYRLVPATKFADLMATLNDLKDKYFDAAEEIVSKRDELADDHRKRVKDLADEVPFPTAQELRRAYRFEIRQMPIPDINDIRLRHMDPRMVDSIRADVDQLYAERLHAAQVEIIDRLRERVSSIREAMTRKEGKLHDSLATNLDKEIEALPSLNITGNPEIARLIARVKDELSGLQIDSLKVSKKQKPAERKAVLATRKLVAESASSVLDDLKNFGVS